MSSPVELLKKIYPARYITSEHGKPTNLGPRDIIFEQPIGSRQAEQATSGKHCERQILGAKS